MNLEELRQHVLDNVEHCYLVKNSKIYKLNIRICKDGKKDVSDFCEVEPRSFTVGFENPNKKVVFKPYNARPFIDVMGIDENGKLILTDFEKEGFDVPNAWMTIHGDIYLTEKQAKIGF